MTIITLRIVKHDRNLGFLAFLRDLQVAAAMSGPAIRARPVVMVVHLNVGHELDLAYVVLNVVHRSSISKLSEIFQIQVLFQV